MSEAPAAPSDTRVIAGLGGTVDSTVIRYRGAVVISPAHRASRSVSWCDSGPPSRCAPNTTNSRSSVMALQPTGLRPPPTCTAVPYPTWHSAPYIPHDGFLADFLMRNKGFIRG